MTHKEKLSKLRQLMLQNKTDAYVVFLNDPHIGEYIPEYWQIISWLSGFNGSNATIVVTHDFAGLWTDSRYFIQAEKQLENSGISLMKQKIPYRPEYIEWLYENMPHGSTVAFDGYQASVYISRALQARLSEKNININPNLDLISPLWKNRPNLPSYKAFLLSDEYTGNSRKNKIRSILNKMNEDNVKYHFVAALDDIAWILNIRSFDLEYSPLLLSFLFLSEKEKILFVNKEKIPENVEKELKSDDIMIKNYDETEEYLKNLQEGTILIDENTLNYKLLKAIPEKCKIINNYNYSTILKAQKNKTEKKSMLSAAINDFLALEKFFYWLDTNIGKTKITELSAAKKLREYRQEHTDYVMDSFATISAYAEHAAMPHYEPTPETDKELKPKGLFLIDSGAHYTGGTTDITRVVPLGETTKQERTAYTLTIAGMADLAMAKFPENTHGFHLDAIARMPLWKNGMDYGHGTGHGVGAMLNVHEGPQSIRKNAVANEHTTLKQGMILSNEPSFYEQGKFGVRTENLMFVRKSDQYDGYLEFETYTLCHIDTTIIEKKLLTDEQKNWINNYNKKVNEYFKTYFSEKLKEKTLNTLLKWIETKTPEI